MSRTVRHRFKILLALSALGLSACGEGYELVKTTDYFPYGNQRTAGSGVAYVLSSMLPEKEVKLDPIEEDLGKIEMPEEEPEVVEAKEPEAVVTVEPEEELKQMDEVFAETQRK